MRSIRMPRTKPTTTFGATQAAQNPDDNHKSKSDLEENFRYPFDCTIQNPQQNHQKKINSLPSFSEAPAAVIACSLMLTGASNADRIHLDLIPMSAPNWLFKMPVISTEPLTVAQSFHATDHIIGDYLNCILCGC